jgi:murein DD-endopeptidase MepM/ murein hydrolase activator NlpD
MMKVASSLASSTQRLVSSVSKLVSTKSPLVRTQEEESGEYQEKIFSTTYLSNLKNQTKILTNISETLRKIALEVSSIRRTLEEWYERRNQISLRDLVSGAFSFMSTLLRLPQGALRVLQRLLAPAAAYLLGRALPGILRRGRGAEREGGRGLGGERGPRGGTFVGIDMDKKEKRPERRTIRERIYELGRRTRERASRTLERVSRRAPFISRVAQSTRRVVERVRESPILTRTGEFLGKIGEKTDAIGKSGLGALRGLAGVGARALSRVIPIAAIASLGYDFVNNFLEAKKNFGGGLGGFLKSAGASAISTLSLGLIPPEVSSRFVKAISDALSVLAQRVVEGLKSVFSGIFEILSKSYDFIREKVSSGLDFIGNAISSARDFIFQSISGLSSWISGEVSSLTKLLSSGFENIKNFARGVSESASSLAGKVSSWFSEKVISGVNIAKEISSKIGEFVSSVVQNITSGISSFFEGVKNFFADIGQKIVSDPIGTIKTLVIGFKDIINTIIQKAVKGPSGGAKDNRPPAPPSATKPDVGFIPVRSAAADPRHPGSLPSIGPSSDIVGVYQNVVRAAVGDYPVTQLIGQNRPYYDSHGNLVNPMGYGRYGHMGIDVATPVGTPVLAPFSGVVVDASGGAWGKSIYLVGRNVALRFSHLSSIEVPSGSVVKAGQVIAKTGNTGNSTGPHLDITAYTARDGKVGTWISNYQVINRLVSSEVGGKPLSEKELAELQSKVRGGLPKIQQAAFDQNLVPVTTSFSLALQGVAERAASLLGLDPGRVGEVVSALKQRMAQFSLYLENLNRGRIVDIRESEKMIREIIGKPERFTTYPMIKYDKDETPSSYSSKGASKMPAPGRDKGKAIVKESERKVDFATYEATTGERIRRQQLRRRAYNYALEQNRIAKSQGKEPPYDTLGILQGKYDDYILKHNGVPPRKDEVAPKTKTPPAPPPLKVGDKKGTSQPGGKAPPQGTKPQTKPQGTKTPAPAPKPKAPPTPSPGTKKSGDAATAKAAQASANSGLDQNLSGYLDKLLPGGESKGTGPVPTSAQGSPAQPVQTATGQAPQAFRSTAGPQAAGSQALVQSRPSPMEKITPSLNLKYTPTSPPQVNVTPPQAPTSPMAATPAYVGTGAKTTSNESIQELLLINTLIG